MKAKRFLKILGAVVIIVIAIVTIALYMFYLWISPSGIVKITTTAIDRGDHITFDIHVANVDTSRYLSNFSFSFVSYQQGAYKAILKNIVPAVGHTNKYYVFGPSNTWDDQVITLDSLLKLGRGESIFAQFVIMNNPSINIAEIHGSVSYRGQRVVERITPHIGRGMGSGVHLPLRGWSASGGGQRGQA